MLPLLALTAVVSRFGMAGSPQRIDDEGTYTAQAYAVEKLGTLTHYTYWYDHPPLGWVQIAGWTWLTDGFDRYDVSVLAAREAMVAFHVVAAALLWVLARRLDLGRPAAAVALVLFALSPLSLQFSRTVYLDNVALPWLIAAFVLALSRQRQLLAFAGSALCFGVAVLSKETFLLVLPFLAWQMWRSAGADTRRYTLSVAGSLLTLVLSAYALFALVKGEVFPGRDRVSLFEGIAFQLVSREDSGSVLDRTSQAGRSVAVWLTLDPVLPVAAVVAGLVALTVSRLRVYAVTFLALTAVVFKPGYLPVPYVVVLLPFAALLVAAVVDLGVRRGGRWVTALTVVASVVAAVVAVPLWAVQQRGLFLADLDRPLREAQTWITQNVDRGDRLLVDDASWVDLVEAGFPRQDVVWYYKADTDSDVSALAPGGWTDYDYVLVTQALRRSIDTAPTVQDALDNSTRTAIFGSGENQVEVYRVDDRGRQAIDEAVQRDQQARTAAGQALLENPRLRLSDQAASQLRDGEVDARLVSLLAQVSSETTIEVADFPAVFGEDGQVPRRTLTVTSVDGEPVDSAAGDDLVASIRGQVGSFAPQEAARDDGELIVRYAGADPTDLLPATTP
ncbi:ArnT family glycosyltransferase [Nocardioides scoriae]|uniref:ArnT family glycosyltransferase n=1 Tax=Nocardioides scoriae TaxID=642780 RepID=UPI0012FBEA93|nr:glycosyltransferase [Nocardioides scoriae]